MNRDELFTICPPPRELSFCHQLKDDIESLRLKRTGQENEFLTFTDSSDLINFLNKVFKRNSYYEASPYDILTKISYKRVEYDGDIKYFYRVSSTIHYGTYRNEKFFRVISDKTPDEDVINLLYQQKVDFTRVEKAKELSRQRATWSDMVLINRRLLEHDWRALQRGFDSRLIIFKYDWCNNILL